MNILVEQSHLADEEVEVLRKRHADPIHFFAFQFGNQTLTAAFIEAHSDDAPGLYHITVITLDDVAVDGLCFILDRRGRKQLARARSCNGRLLMDVEALA